MEGLFEFERNQDQATEKFRIALEMNNIVESVDLYRSIIKQIIEYMEIQFEICI
ncbi:MAG: hypothetical protein Q8936_20530 [Bacillota bacterium]|nr:hypothetical protein [Bacillota bacterium]